MMINKNKIIMMNGNDMMIKNKNKSNMIKESDDK